MSVSIRRYLHTLFNTPPHRLARRVLRLLARRACRIAQRRRDHQRSTYRCNAPPPGPLNLRLSALQSVRPYPPSEAGRTALALQLDHRFDLLGSGWVQVRHGMSCRGLEGHVYPPGPTVTADTAGHWLVGRINPANLKEAQRIWRLVDSNYTPIDWHLDFKSGYRWPENSWYRDIPYGHAPGVDIKVPWELGRMQHLPSFALAYAHAGDERYARKFRNQVLDFIATNPPRFGVNWAMTMDVALRVANWLLAYDLVRTHGRAFDEPFEIVFRRSVYEHGQHIVRNLEWDDNLRGNHYLADVVGLLFVAAYMPTTPETAAWLALATQEFVAELELQFFPDGANFEASTCYHRLSSEIAVYAVALLLGLPADKQAALKCYDHRRLKWATPRLKPAPLTLHPLSDGRITPLPPQLLERLERAAEFVQHSTKPNGHAPQFGDNDNGRLFKLQPVYRPPTLATARRRFPSASNHEEIADMDIYPDENHLDHRHLIGAINGLFERSDFARMSIDYKLESEIVRQLAGNIRLPSYRQNYPAAARVRIGDRSVWRSREQEWEALPQSQRWSQTIPAPGTDLRDGLELYAYPNFGLYLFCSPRLYLAVRCGPIGQRGHGGHAHNDQLGLELMLDDHEIIRDPGTYLYTPLPVRRNEYRAAAAHFVPRLDGEEPGDLTLGLFRLGGDPQAECHYFGEHGFIGGHTGYSQPVWRIVAITSTAIVIKDGTRGPKPLRNAYQPPSYSPGYGICSA